MCMMDKRGFLPHPWANQIDSMNNAQVEAVKKNLATKQEEKTWSLVIVCQLNEQENIAKWISHELGDAIPLRMLWSYLHAHKQHHKKFIWKFILSVLTNNQTTHQTLTPNPLRESNRYTFTNNWC